MADDKRRKVINRLVAPDTVTLLKSLAASLGLSEGRVIDRAVAALAVAESFGGEHLRLPEPAQEKPPYSHQFVSSGLKRNDICGHVIREKPLLLCGYSRGEHLRLPELKQEAKYGDGSGTLAADTALILGRNPTQADVDEARRYLDATGIDRNSKRGRASLEVVQPLRRAHERTTRNMKRAINKPPKFEHPNVPDTAEVER